MKHSILSLTFTVCLCMLVPVQYGNKTEEESVVYPGEVEVHVDLDPGDITCPDMTTDDISCTVNITRDDNYTVSLTLSNDVGSTQLVIATFNCKLSVNCPMLTEHYGQC